MMGWIRREERILCLGSKNMESFICHGLDSQRDSDEKGQILFSLFVFAEVGHPRTSEGPPRPESKI